MKKVLLTGGAGYIGSVLTEELIKNNYSVTVLDNFQYRQTSLAHLCHHTNLEIVNKDVRDKRVTRDLIKKNDLIIPLAALVGAPLCDKDPFGATSVNKSAVLDILKSVSVDQAIIMPTTNSAYGNGNGEIFCTEDTPLNPISHYACEKVEVESALMQHENSISLRLATVFGMSPRMRLDLLVNDFTFKALVDRSIVLFEPNFKRNFIHVRDVAASMIFMIENFERCRNEIFNLGLSSANLSKLELCQIIKSHLPDLHITIAENAKDPDQRDYIVSNKKIEDRGFRPSFSLDMGITELLLGYQMMPRYQFGNI